MRILFADTFYWIAILNPKDEWHSKVIKFSNTLTDYKLIVTDEIIDEIFNFFAKHGKQMREKVYQLSQAISKDPNIEIITPTPSIRQAGIELYGKRLDKGYSLTDCISIVVMKDRNIPEVLTHDYHFTQEGFTIIFPGNPN